MRSPPNHVRALVERLWSEAGDWTPTTPDPQVATAAVVAHPRTDIAEARTRLAGPVGALIAFWIRKQVGAQWCELTWTRSFDGVVRERVTAGGAERRAWREPEWPKREPFHGLVLHGDGLHTPYTLPFERSGARWERIDLTLGPGPAGREAPAVALSAALDFYPTDARLLRSTLHALQRREWVQRAEVLRQAVGAWASGTRRLDRPALEAACALAARVQSVAAICPPTGVSAAPVRDAAERLALAVSNSIFGVGWRRRDVHVLRADATHDDGVTQARTLALALGRATRALAHQSSAPRSWGQLHRTAAAARLIAEVEPVDGAPTPEAPTRPSPHGALAADLGPLLARWARLQEALRHPPVGVLPPAGVPQDLAADTRAVVGRWLTHWSDAPAEHPGPDHRTLLALWFIVHLLGPSAAGRCIFRLRAKHLAFATRELLRRVVFGRQADYREATSDLLEALAHLVAHHAEDHLQLPGELELAPLLARIGTTGPRGATGHALQHLEHVIEVYIGAQALLSMGLPDTEPGTTLAHLLTGAIAGQEDKADGLRREVALAAVYHDTGLLLPSGALGPERPSDADDEPGLAALGRYRRSRNEASKALLSACAAALRDQQVLSQDPTDPLGQRIDALASRGDAHHAVTGAWYLVERLARVERVPGTVRTQAARAVLLHSLAATRIDARKDAAGAILVLCDELFDWEPALTTLGPPGSRRTARSRYRSVRFPIRFDAAAPTPSGLVAVLDEGDWVVDAALPAPTPTAVPVWHGWLVLAQDLGRIDWDGAARFRPVLRLRCPHMVHDDRTVSIAALLLGALSEETRDGWDLLRDWLWDAVDREAQGEVDVLRIGTRAGRLANDDVRLLLPALDSAFSDALVRLKQGR